MERELINKMKSQKRLFLNLKQNFNHYSVVLFLLARPIYFIPSIFKIIVLKDLSGSLSLQELLEPSLIFLFLAVLFAILQYRRLNFKEIKITYTNVQFKEALTRTVSEINWKIINNNKDILIAYRPNDWKSGSWGEMITIVKEDDCLLMNSICAPDAWPSVISFGNNLRNLKVFLKNLIDIIQQIPVTEKAEPTINNWSFKEIILRVFLYPFCIFLIFIGFYMVFNRTTIISSIAGIGAITASAFYFYSDFRFYWKNRNAQKSPDR
jgi:hypothetical protein